MAEMLHPTAPDHLPPFITAPGRTDVLLVFAGVLLVLSVLGVGVLFLRLHHLPEHLAHKSQKVQYEVVAVLGLLAMFTHIHLFWVAALLLALIDLPDFGGLLGRIARSLEKMAGIKPGGSSVPETEETADVIPDPVLAGEASDSLTAVPHDTDVLPDRPVADVSTLRTRGVKS